MERIDERRACTQFSRSSYGGHSLIVTYVWGILAGTSGKRWHEWWPLRGNHHGECRTKEKIGKNEDDEVHRGDPGAYAVDDSSSGPEEYEINEPETNRENDDFFSLAGIAAGRLNSAGPVRSVTA
ncbi:MAG: hypothetical protein JW929_04690 [Anaerolineales bacterium]|nr:hypothetical protein [Anaerolineales bacterium]